MEKLTKFIISIGLFINLSFVYAQKQQIVGKAIMVRGSVTFLSPGMMNAKKASKGQSFLRETSILTGKNSFIRIKFIDGSFLNLGSSSKVILNDFKKTKPGVISLLKGQVRAQIPSKAKKQKGQEDFKFYIKTRNASIGVRGTDFLTLHNTESEVTSILTFEGMVGISNIEDSLLLPSLRKRILGVLNREDLNSILSGGNTQMVTKGKLSGVFPAFKRSIIPVKISPKQFELLERNGNLNFSGKGPIEKYNYEDPKNRKIYKDVKGTRKDADGFYDDINERFQPKAGGYLDIASGIYIQPEPGSKYDELNNVYIVSGDFGKVDSKHGNYIPPKGLKIDNRKGFVLDDMSDESRFNLAREVFGIAEGKLSRSVREKMEKSLKQILVTKKAILNQEIKTDILKTPLDDDEYIYEISKEFSRMKYLFKEVLRTRVALFFAQDLEAYETFYNEIVKSTKKKRSSVKGKVDLSYSNYVSEKWIVRPKFNFGFDYGLNSSSEDLKEVNKTSFNISFDSFYNSTIFKIPTTLILGVQIGRESKFEKKHKSYETPFVKDIEEKNLFKRDLVFRIGESLRLNEFNTIGVEFNYLNYDGFSTLLNGKGTRYTFSYSKKILPRYEFNVSATSQQLSSKINSNDTDSVILGAGFNIFEIKDIYSLLFKVEKTKIEFSNINRANSLGKEKSLEFKTYIRRKMTPEWMIEVSHNYFSYDSREKERNVDNHKFEIGTFYEF